MTPALSARDTRQTTRPSLSGTSNEENSDPAKSEEIRTSDAESYCQSLNGWQDAKSSQFFRPPSGPPTGIMRSGRRSVRTSRADVSQSLQEIENSLSSEKQWRLSSEGEVVQTTPGTALPLSDVTNILAHDALQKEDRKAKTVEEHRPVNVSNLEKPMDIVIRTRTKNPAAVVEDMKPKPRLVIDSLVLTNFKSYAGRQEIGPFHTSFSSVVGPNGSGKSNVIDSLLFVFGFRASKMRQGKISALIHNSATFPDLTFCEVEVHFQEVIDQLCGRADIVPNSRLVISRKAFKNNSSKYFLNSVESSFTTVTGLLRDRGVDLDHKRFLILQGEVESIAQMKPKALSEHDDGLLEYLEDIIGTSKYKMPIQESSAETERLNEICIEKANRVSHVENEKSSLEDKKDTALAYIKDENELAIKQSALYQIYIAECNNNIEIAQESVSQMQTQINRESEKHGNSETEIQTINSEYLAESINFERMEQNLQTMLKQLTKADKEAVKSEEKEKHLQAKMKKLETSISSGRMGLSETAATIDRLADDLRRNSNALSDIEQRLRAEDDLLRQIRDGLTGKTQGLSDQINSKQNLLDPWIEQINEKKATIAVAQSELAMLKERDDSGAAALAQAQSRLVNFRNEKNFRVSDLASLKTEVSTLEEESRQLLYSIEEIEQAEPDQRAKLSSARQKADEAHASLSKTQTQGNVLAGLNRLKESGRVRGFHGRLGDLGTIDTKYDIAISTACPALDNLVVESVEVAQQCIDYLRKNGLGRANFIVLNRLGSRNTEPIETPENVARLFDLVRAKDELFVPAFYSVLQDTLVASDLGQANRIAYGAKRWRVATLDGQLIDKSGTMSGGGTRIMKGSMSSTTHSETTKEKVAALEAKKEEFEIAIQDMQLRKQTLESSLKNVEGRLPQCATKIQKCSLDIESLDRNIMDAEKRCLELNAKCVDLDRNEAEMRRLENIISKAEEEIAELEHNASGLRNEIQALQEKIMEVGGVKLRSQKAKVDGLKDQMNGLTEEMSGAEVSRTKAEKQKSKHQVSTKEAERDLEGLVTEIEKIKTGAQRLRNETEGLKSNTELAQEDIDSKRDALERMKLAIDEKTADLNEAKRFELEMRNQFEEQQKTLSENQKRLRYWEEKLKNLRIQDISDFIEEAKEHDFVTFTRDELVDIDKDLIKGEIAMLEEKTVNANVELGVLSEYRRRVEEHATRSSDLAEAISTRDSIKRQCEELRRLRLEGFMEGFSAISLRLKEMYQMITMGGNAELELVDSLDPFSEGILFSVMPPKKSWKNISNLSGGEKTLSSLALVFALHHYKPTPLYVMDEIDAALDFRNVSIVASYIKERTKNAQFIVISLRNNMFELASRLVGVYKVNQMTKSVTVENRDYLIRAA